MIKGARKLPVQHITIRVPWHDSGWNGTVCKNPCGNTSCMVLPRIGTSRNDAHEFKFAGQSLEQMNVDDFPPCVDEHATFMAKFPQIFTKKHPYRNSSADTHGHFEDTPYHVSPHAVAAVPFRWMLRAEVDGDTKKKIVGKAQQFSLGYQLEREPRMNFGTQWVQEGNNQRVLLDTFFSALEPEASLVFFYAKRTPLSEDPGRVIVGVGRVKQIGAPLEYNYSKDAPTGALKGYLWERNIHHSIRLNGDDGFLLPYHKLLDIAEKDSSIDLKACTAFSPEEAFEEYSYGSEILTQDSAIASLLSCEKALKAIRHHIQGPWDQYLAWIDQEMNRLWQARGPFPGMGAALSAFNMVHGNLLAWYLAESSDKDKIVDPWLQFESVLKDPKSLPSYLQESIGPTLAQKWQQIPAERKALLKLLSRFVLTNKQASRWYQLDLRQDAGIELSDADILHNPYQLYEADRTQENPISFDVIDRGLFPPLLLREAMPVPAPSNVAEDIDKRRVRALMIAQLERGATEGHTFLPDSWIIQRVRGLAMQPACPLDADVLPIFDDVLAPEINLLLSEDKSRAYQLRRYADAKTCIAAAIRKRVKSKQLLGEHNWSSFVNEAIGDSAPKSDWDDLEQQARDEKTKALEMLFRSRVSVLMGAAGTGKSTLIKALCRIPGILSDGIILLAPTGKARVRLEQASGMHGKGKTIAQFLHKFKRYDGETGRYFMDPDAEKSVGYKTVVIDEASMLTEDQFAALLDTFEGVERLILVGDPKQLPPIGAGRPFVDIVNELRPENAHALLPCVIQGYAELLVTRRQQGQRLDLLLANYFNGSQGDAGRDEIWGHLRKEQSSHVQLKQWRTPESLQTALVQALIEELPLESDVDEVGFACSLGGKPYNGRAYFWPKYGDNPGAASKAESWQILSPLRTSQVGSDAINRFIQTKFRASELKNAAEFYPWKRSINQPFGPQGIIWGDKVINVVNSGRRSSWPEMDGSYVANGDIGIVTGSLKTTKKKLFKNLEVELSTQLGMAFKYWPGEFDGEKGSPPLELAYALTVHKTQGSEFGKTFLVIPNPCHLLTREMLYTALTRQKDKVVILFQGELSDLHRYSLDSASEVKRRMTNLFRQSVPTELTIDNKKVFLDEFLIYKTERGELVRSKTEWIIADKLSDAGIHYHYEHPLILDGVNRYPDFMIRDDDAGITWYWEHLGMMQLHEYKERWKNKLAAYRKEKIVPIEEYDPASSKGILLTTIEDGLRTDLSEQIGKAVEIIKNGF